MNPPTLKLQKADQALFPILKELLEAVELPTADLTEKIHLYYSMGDTEAPIACGGFEQYGQIGLLRSIAIHQEVQGKGIGRLWVSQLLEEAKRMGMQELYLLTTTAAQFFTKMGFSQQQRDHVPQAIKDSEEFSSLCPSTAVLMCKKL
ncbi:MAG: arsenic resistance N-acetyltransferase ArsN2 [Bacteroidota bacterium]